MSGLLEQVEATLRQRGLLRRRQAVLVAVSGGVDSMVLLHILHELSRRHAWRLTIAHFNHRLRGRSSDADERLVVRAARQLGWPVVVGRADVKKLARAEKLSLEMAARQARHDFLARTAARLKIRTIALAHHADDQVELFFLRLFRGSGGEGLAGMKWRNPSPSDARIELIRPLLDETKAALREFALRQKILFREDATNASPDMQRNRIRHDLLPRLRRQYQPALDRTVLRVMEIAGVESEFAAAASKTWLAGKRRPPSGFQKPVGADVRRLKLPGTQGIWRLLTSSPAVLKEPPPFDDLPVAVQRRCVQLQLQSLGVAADYDLIEHLRTAPGGRITVGPRLAAQRNSQGEVRVFPEPEPTVNAGAINVKIAGRAGEIVFGGQSIHWSISGHRGPIPLQPRAGREIFDADKVGPEIVVRHWRPGDRFQPCGMPAPVKLQDLFVNQKIAREARHGLLVATTAAGEVFWVQQLRIAERFKLSKRTIRGLHWRWKPL